ncbi:MAG: LysR family transcriptional regulator [Alphaproteobacteria bacterium]|nr:LysR family transcriptional regulator [Alphaproteobacteria bacterium SS10]
MDRFASLRGFVAVVDHGGFAPAARSMGLATSSLTRQVNALEAHLGTVLLNRSTRSLSLTEAGSQYLADARRILEELAEADRNVREAADRPSGTLRISLPVAFAKLHVSPLLPVFLKRYPDVRIELQATDSVVNLVEERIDVAIRIGSPGSDSLIARKLAPHHRIVCASPAYIEGCGSPSEPSDLTQHNCLVFGRDEIGATWQFTKAKQSQSVRVEGSLKADSSEVLRDAALADLGLVLLPSWLIGQDIKAGALKQILGDWQADLGTDLDGIYAAYLPNRRGSVKLRCFIDFLVEQFGAPPYWEGA